MILDIRDLENPAFLGRIRYDGTDEGNTHSVFPVDGDRLLLVADEDFSVRGSTVEVLEPARLASTITSAEGANSPILCERGEVTGKAVFAGQACNGAPIPSEVQGNIAIAELGACSPDVKIALLQNAGAAAIVMCDSKCCACDPDMGLSENF